MSFSWIKLPLSLVMIIQIVRWYGHRNWFHLVADVPAKNIIGLVITILWLVALLSLEAKTEILAWVKYKPIKMLLQTFLAVVFSNTLEVVLYRHIIDYIPISLFGEVHVMNIADVVLFATKGGAPFVAGFYLLRLYQSSKEK